MAIEVVIPTQLRVDTTAVQSQPGAIIESLELALGRAFGRSSQALAAHGFDANGATLGTPSIVWSGSGLSTLSNADRLSLEVAIVATFRRAAGSSGVGVAGALARPGAAKLPQPVVSAATRPGFVPPPGSEAVISVPTEDETPRPAVAPEAELPAPEPREPAAPAYADSTPTSEAPPPERTGFVARLATAAESPFFALDQFDIAFLQELGAFLETNEGLLDEDSLLPAELDALFAFEIAADTPFGRVLLGEGEEQTVRELVSLSADDIAEIAEIAGLPGEAESATAEPNAVASSERAGAIAGREERQIALDGIQDLISRLSVEDPEAAANLTIALLKVGGTRLFEPVIESALDNGPEAAARLLESLANEADERSPGEEGGSDGDRA